MCKDLDSYVYEYSILVYKIFTIIKSKTMIYNIIVFFNKGRTVFSKGIIGERN